MANKKKDLSFKFDNGFITAVLYIVAGILCCFLQSSIIEILIVVVGALFVLQGVYSLTQKDWVNGTINLIIGVVLIVFALTIVEVVLLVFGILIVIKGVKELIDAIRTKDTVSIIAAVITLIVGALLIGTKWAHDIVDCFYIIIGVIFIINGVIKLFGKK